MVRGILVNTNLPSEADLGNKPAQCSEKTTYGACVPADTAQVPRGGAPAWRQEQSPHPGEEGDPRGIPWPSSLPTHPADSLPQMKRKLGKKC